MQKDPDSDDRREHRRYPVRLVVHFSAGDKSYRLVSENLSLGGIFLRGADETCAEGDEVELEIVVADEDGLEQRASVAGAVVQRLSGAGAGVRFDWDRTAEGARPLLESFIKRMGMLSEGAIHEEHVGLATDAEED